MDKQPRKRPGETAFGFILLAVSLVFAWQSYRISGFSALSSPGAFPLAASAVMVIAALIVVSNNLRRRALDKAKVQQSERADSFAAQVMPSVVVVFAGFMIGYAALLEVLGFLPASLLFLFVAIHFLHRRRVAFSFAVALGSLLAIYVVFRLVFTVVLPEGIVPEREIMAWIGRLFNPTEVAQ